MNNNIELHDIIIKLLEYTKYHNKCDDIRKKLIILYHLKSTNLIDHSTDTNKLFNKHVFELVSIIR